jgi:predicted TIM-barrel fold metal-dependent hydrolase
MLDVATLPKISADAHVNEPHDLWWKRLPDDLREAAPHRIQTEDDGGWSLVVNGQLDESGGRRGPPATLTPEMRALAAEEDARREQDVSIDARLDMMRTDGLHGEMVYPTIGLYVYGIEQPEVGIASCRVYNDWIHDHLGDDCPRVRYAGLVPTWDTRTAIAEIQRIAHWRGIGALMLPLVGTPSWNDQLWEPLWAAVAETGLPVVMHQGTGHDMIFYRGWGSPTANLLATQSMAPRTAALLSCGGVLERHPDLHVVLVEVNAGWMAWTMDTLDEYFVAHGARLRKPHLPELPSHYLRRQVHATFQRDPVAIAARGISGVECLMWGNDFPHPEGTFPNSAEVLTDTLGDVDADDAASITGGNARRVFGFDRAILDATP